MLECKKRMAHGSGDLLDFQRCVLRPFGQVLLTRLSLPVLLLTVGVLHGRVV